MDSEGFQYLICRAQGGDREAMDRVLGILQPYMEPLARPFADPSSPAESTSDLLQECCLRAWQKVDGFRGGQNDDETFKMFRAWMGQILRRLGLNARRDRSLKGRIPPQKVQPLPSEAAESTNPRGRPVLQATTPTPSAGARAAEMTHQIESALGRLPDPTAATIVRMRFFEELTFPKISERLGLSRSRVREHHRWAMRRLRREVGEWL